MPDDLATVAKAIKVSLRLDGRGAGEAEARRLAFSFVETLDKAPVSRVAALVEVEPEAVGDARFDALLGAVAEHGCARRGRPAPGWVNSRCRFLETWWFMSGMASLHADALVHSPISFARRGVFITSGALSYA